MTARAQLEKNILLALNVADGVPMPESALVRSVKVLSMPEEPTTGDVLNALKSAEDKKYADGVSEDLEERTWTLTTKGKHKARQL